MPPWGDVLGMSHRTETSRKTQGYVSQLEWEHLGVLLGVLVEAWHQ